MHQRCKNRNKKIRYFAAIGKIALKNKIENGGYFADSGKKNNRGGITCLGCSFILTN